MWSVNQSQVSMLQSQSQEISLKISPLLVILCPVTGFRMSGLRPPFPFVGHSLHSSDVIPLLFSVLLQALAKVDAKNASGPSSSSARAPSPPQWLVDTWEKAAQEDG